MEKKEKVNAKTFYLASNVCGLHNRANNTVELNESDLYKLMTDYAEYQRNNNNNIKNIPIRVIEFHKDIKTLNYNDIIEIHTSDINKNVKNININTVKLVQEVTTGSCSECIFKEYDCHNIKIGNNLDITNICIVKHCIFKELNNNN